MPAAAEQRAQPVDGREEVAAGVLLHHRKQQVAAGVARQPAVLEHRQPRQQNRARLALVARQRQRALQHVARRQHAQLVAQLPRRPAAVEHGDDGVEIDPGIVLEAAEQARQAGAAAEAADLQDTQTHATIYSVHTRPASRMSRLGSQLRDGAADLQPAETLE